MLCHVATPPLFRAKVSKDSDQRQRSDVIAQQSVRRPRVGVRSGWQVASSTGALRHERHDRVAVFVTPSKVKVLNQKCEL